MTPTPAHPPRLPAWAFIALYAVLLLCVPSRLIFGPLGAAGTPANLLGMACLLWWSCSLLAGLIHVQGLTPSRVVGALFFSTVLASYSAGHVAGWYQPADIHQVTDRYWQQANVAQVTATITSAADRGLLAMAGWMGVMFVASDGVRTWRALERLVGWLVGAGAVAAAMGIVQYFTGLNIAAYIRIPGLQGLTEFGEALSRAELNRIVGTAAHPIELGVAMASLLPLAMHRSLHGKGWLNWLPTVLIGTAAMMSVSRSAIVVAAVCLVVLMIGWPWRRRVVALALLPVAALAVRAALPGLLGTIRALFGAFDVDPSISARTEDYPLVLGIVADQLLFGQGLFTFIPMVYRTLDNQVLMLLLELGVVGTLVFVLLMLIGQLNAWRPWRRQGSPTQRHLGLALSASMAGIASSFLTFDALSFRQVAGLLFLYLGLSGAVWNIAGQTSDPSNDQAPRRWLRKNSSFSSSSIST